VIEGRIIVCLANSWDYDPTSKHQIMKILSRRNEIVWINYHGTRRPTVGRADFAAACSALKRVTRGVQRVSRSIVQLTPLVIPGAESALLQRVHQRMLIAQIRRAVRSIVDPGERRVQVWSFAPDVPYLVGQFDEECFVYYCVDEYSQFEGLNASRIISAEHDLIDRADVVVTTSEQLFNTKRARRPDVILMRHGVDYKHFARAWREPPPRPPDLNSIRGPVFGFFGLIHHWVDLALIAQVARLRPDYTFVLIGEAKVDVSELRNLSNVILAGRRPYERLPGYCAAFDAGLLLFTRSAMTRNINPIKMYEYLAAGLPVVSTPLPEARRYAGPIKIAETAEEFAEACDGVIADDYPGRREDISRLVEGESWRSKVDCLSDIILERLGSPSRPVSIPRSKVAMPTPPPVGVIE
jgi:glycosyltransferase involved in cell wall biosynthesis